MRVEHRVEHCFVLHQRIAFRVVDDAPRRGRRLRRRGIVDRARRVICPAGPVQIDDAPEDDERDARDDCAENDDRAGAERHFHHIKVVAPVIVQ